MRVNRMQRNGRVGAACVRVCVRMSREGQRHRCQSAARPVPRAAANAYVRCRKAQGRHRNKRISTKRAKPQGCLRRTVKTGEVGNAERKATQAEAAAVNARDEMTEVQPCAAGRRTQRHSPVDTHEKERICHAMV